MMKTPLAWKNLTADWRRLALSVAGVGFAVVLMFMQSGFRNALLDSPVQLPKSFRADLVAISVARSSLPTEESFPRWLLDRAAADPQVAAVTPIYLERSRAQIRVVPSTRRPIRVVGVPLEPEWFVNRELASALPRLAAPDVGLLDRRSRQQYGFATQSDQALAEQEVELADRRLRWVGTVDIGTDFANEGTVLMSRDNFARYFPLRGQATGGGQMMIAGDPLDAVDWGLMRLSVGANPSDVAERLTRLAPTIWAVYPHEKLIDREIDFWNRQTPIGTIFFVGAMMGFAVGVIICYQILFTSIHDSMAEFATLKAIGYDNRFFFSLIVRQSIYLSLLGFIPAVLVSRLLFSWLQSWIGLPMLMTTERAAGVLGLTILMCLVSGLLALRKLVTADPATLF